MKESEEVVTTKILYALLATDRTIYKSLRESLIAEYGYDSFRACQKTAFKKIQDDYWSKNK